MTTQEQNKLANHIMRLLKVRSVSFPVALTDKGPLSVKYTVDQPEYEIVLDAVPLTTDSVMNDESNIELKAMLERYFFDSQVITLSKSPVEPITSQQIEAAKSLIETIGDNGKGIVH